MAQVRREPQSEQHWGYAALPALQSGAAWRSHLGNCVFQQHGELHQVVVLDPHDVAMLVGCDDDIGKLLVRNLHSSQDGK